MQVFCLLVMVPFAQWPMPREVWPGMETLACTLQLVPTGGQEIGLAFELRNSGDRVVTAHSFTPFLDFVLTARADDGEIPIVQPGYDTGQQPIVMTIPAGESNRIATPIRLRFDPDVPPSGGDDPTIWTLQHAAVPVLLRATLSLEGATVSPCEARWVPT
jgi:hypothetical protein